MLELGLRLAWGLARLDILQSLQALSTTTGDELPLRLARDLTAEEPSDKYRKQYEKALRTPD